MVIFFGTGSAKIAEKRISAECPRCKTPGNVVITVQQRYLSLIFIPFFPTDKMAVSRCDNCGEVLLMNYFPTTFWDGYHEAMLGTKKKPWWMYTGLGLIALGIGATVISSVIDDMDDAKYIADPKKGDVYQVKLNDDEYTLYKVDKVEGNMVYVFENTYISNLEGISKIEEKPFAEKSHPLAKTALKALYEKGDIIEVDR